ncbi:glycosyltransferase family 2 protein [Crocinitomicaceae bacterium]|jgi:glycosyltransferase involved in cell wall biosynthesis|nr:glycosyltransferase family 2 protein [Crocinitomicaceae bacterium]
MRKVAAAIITFNEERNIERCITGLLECVDEIVVMDSFSNDETKNICNQYGVRFIENNWQGYAQTKNKLNDLIDADYIFSIDADEVPDRILQEQILKIKSNPKEHIYILNRYTNYCGKWIKHCGWYPEFKARIFPKNKAKWEGEFVHENLNYDKSIEGVILDGHLEHYSYYNRIEHQERANKYALLVAKKYFHEGKSTYVFQPEISAIVKFINVFLIKKGFLDGYYGFQIARISASSNHLKYRELKRLSKTDR